MGDFFGFFLGHLDEIAEQTWEHIGLTAVSLAFALVLSLPVGVLLTRWKKAAGPVIGAVGVIQTIPSMALLGLLLPLLGIGAVPAIVALFLYALLPIIRNTYAGITEVDRAVIEAADGMGMTGFQRLIRVEFPLAAPVIFAGIRTATVINVGVATLAALIAAGGLGEFIFRGISLNNTNMLVAGAVPAALLAILFDSLLGIIQRFIRRIVKPLLVAAALLLFVVVPAFYLPAFFSDPFLAGFVPEFMLRDDGYQGLRKHYGLELKTVEIESGLMFHALNNGEVDVISGYSTDGRIKAFDFVILEDNLGFFPPYLAAPLVNGLTLRRHPELQDVLGTLAGRIGNAEMAALNYQVDFKKKLPREVARDFLTAEGIEVVPDKTGVPDIAIGSKNFTEQYVIAYIMEMLIESRTNLVVESRIGLAGTKTCFDALIAGEIDLYPEYTGTGLLVLIRPGKRTVDSLLTGKQPVLEYVRDEMQNRFDAVWLEPFGFNNSWALMMRRNDASDRSIMSISDLVRHLKR